MNHLRLAVRTMLRTPFLTAVAIASLSLGIGANAAIFSLFDEMLLRPLPVDEPERLVNLANPGPKPGSQSCGGAGDCDEVFSYRMFRDIEERAESFSGLAAHRPVSVNLAFDGRTTNGEGLLVSGSYFPVLGLTPALGRLLGPADDRTVGGHFAVALSHGYWERELGADPGAVGRTLTVNGHPFTVVGVAPEGFKGTTLGLAPAVFVPLTMRGVLEPWFDDFENRRSYWAYVFGRLAPGATLERARSEAGQLYRDVVREVEAPLQTGMSEQTMTRFLAKELLVEEGTRGQSSLHGEVRTPLLFLLGTTLVVLLIACANIANLLLARGAARSHEMAIRGSLGASRLRLLAQLLTESGVLALAGGAASLLVAGWTLDLLASILPPELAATFTLGLRPPVLLFTAGVAVATGLLFGTYPALHATRTDLAGALRSATGQAAGARKAARFRTSLVTAQIGLSMALLLGAGLFVRSLVNVSRVDLGLDSDRVVTFALSPALNGYEPERSLELFRRLEEELAAIPGARAVTGALVPLLAGSNWGNDVSVEGFEGGPDVDQNARYNEVGSGYFRTLGVPLIAGREFTDADIVGQPKVAIVNETFAKKFGLDVRDAVGKRMKRGRGDGDLDVEIVGVVRDAKYSEVKQVVPPLFFTPYRQNASFLGFLNLYVRTATPPDGAMAQIRSVVSRLDPDLPVERLKTLDDQIRENVVIDRVVTILSSAFAALATLLAGVGLYGVLAYTVAQRTREIGVRMAFGAGGVRVRRMVLVQVARMTVVGGVAGIAAALAAGRWAESLLFEMSPSDPVTIASVVVVLSAVALAAGYLPARKASRVDPMVALRE